MDAIDDLITGPAGAASREVYFVNEVHSARRGPSFMFAMIFYILVWFFIALSYIYVKWRYQTGPKYIVPRVFVLCSPRTVQFTYELILRVGLPSADFNPEKHDIDLTVLGNHRNEVVPMTRLNTRGLQDELLVTSLSMIVYRLVEMPFLGGIIVKHSGPFKAWLYAYDFTLIDVATQRELFFPLNTYIGSLSKVVDLIEPELPNTVFYPVDDIPTPEYTIEDIYLLLFCVIGFSGLIQNFMPLNCTYYYDFASIAALTVLCLGYLCALEWLVHYYIRWNQERRDYFNDYNRYVVSPAKAKLMLLVFASAILIAGLCFSAKVLYYRNALVWLLVLTNTNILAFGIWNSLRILELGDSIVNLGLRMRKIVSIPITMRYSDLVADTRSKSASTTSDDGGGSLTLASHKLTSYNTNSSVKSYGFDANSAFARVNARNGPASASRVGLRHSSTGATRDNLPTTAILRPVDAQHAVASAKRLNSASSLKHNSNASLGSDKHSSSGRSKRSVSSSEGSSSSGRRMHQSSSSPALAGPPSTSTTTTTKSSTSLTAPSNAGQPSSSMQTANQNLLSNASSSQVQSTISSSSQSSKPHSAGLKK